MGSPTSPALANIFVKWFEDAMLKLAPVTPTVWWGHANDAFRIDKIPVPQFDSNINEQEQGIVLTNC